MENFPYPLIFSLLSKVGNTYLLFLSLSIVNGMLNIAQIAHNIITPIIT